MNEKQPRIAKSIGIFAGIYFSLMLGFGYLFHALGRKPGSSANMIIIMISVWITGRWFVRRHGRSYAQNEYLAVVLGAVGFDVMLQIFFAWSILGFSGFSSKWAMIVLILFSHAVLITTGFSAIVLKRYLSGNPESQLKQEPPTATKVRF